jgi:hypothetical protein
VSKRFEVSRKKFAGSEVLQCCIRKLFAATSTFALVRQHEQSLAKHSLAFHVIFEEGRTLRLLIISLVLRLGFQFCQTLSPLLLLHVVEVKG